MKRKRLLKTTLAIIGLFLLCVIAYLALFPSNDYYENNKNFRQTFGIFTYETLRGDIVDGKISELEKIDNNVENALQYIGDTPTEDLLSPYDYLVRYYSEGTSTSYTITPVKFVSFLNKGYYWLEYSYTRIGKSGIIVSCTNILVLITLEKENDEWIASKIKEGP